MNSVSSSGNSRPTLTQFFDKINNLDPEKEGISINGKSIHIATKTSCKFENQKVWAAFKNALKDRILERRFHRICKRYKLNWDELKDNPLDRRMLKIFHIGLSTLKVEDLQEISEKLLNRCSVEEIQELVDRAGPPFKYRENLQDPKSIHGSPRNMYEQIISGGALKTDRPRCLLLDEVRKLLSTDPCVPPLHPYFQRLASAVAGHFQIDNAKEQDIGLIIPIPVDGTQVDYCKVYEIISGGGCTVIALAPISKDSSFKPSLIFCGTKTSPIDEAIRSFRNDVEENPGETGYNATKEALNALMNDPLFLKGEKVCVLAFSLGGAHATRFVNDHLLKVEEVVGFNIIGTSGKVVESVSKQINALHPNRIPPRIYLHRNVSSRNEGEDLVNCIGQKHIGWGIKHPNSSITIYDWFINKEAPSKEEIDFDLRMLNIWAKFHTYRPMENMGKHPVEIYMGSTQCDPILDTYKRDSRVENLRVFYGNIILSITYWIYSTLDFILRQLGISFFRRGY